MAGPSKSPAAPDADQLFVGRGWGVFARQSQIVYRLLLRAPAGADILPLPPAPPPSSCVTLPTTRPEGGKEGAGAGAGAGAGVWVGAGAGAGAGALALALALALLLRWVGAGEPSRPLTRFVTPASLCYSITYARLVVVFSCSFYFLSTPSFCLFFVCLFVCLYFRPYRVLGSCLFGCCFRRCSCLFLLVLAGSPCPWFVSSAPKSAKMLKNAKGQDTRSLHTQAKPSKAKPVLSAPMPGASCACWHGTAMRAPLGVCLYGAVVLLASLLYDVPTAWPAGRAAGSRP